MSNQSGAGEGARREYLRRRARRAANNEDRFGTTVGRLKTSIERPPQQESAWLRGSQGEVRVAEVLERSLRGSGVVLMHDRRVPGSRANIDHLAVGPGGVTVIDTKRWKGRARADGDKLVVGGRDRSRAIDGVLRQARVVESMLVSGGLRGVNVAPAICWVEVDGLPWLIRPRVRGVMVDSPRRIARLAGRDGDLASGITDFIVATLDRALPRYAQS